MKKHLSIILLTLLSATLTGCSDDSGTIETNTSELSRFKISNTVWQIQIPSNWTKTTPPPAGTVLVATNKDANLILAQKPGTTENLKNLYLTNLANNFFEFEVLTETDTSWTVKGKTEASSPTRIFHEKILDVPNTQSHLIGVCSYEYWPNRTTPCDQVLQSWLTEESI